MIPTVLVQVCVRPGCVLYLRGERAQRRQAIESAWARLRSGSLGRALGWCRVGTESTWRALADDDRAANAWLDAAPCRRLEACADPQGEGASVEFVDLDAVFGQERASSIRILLRPDEDPAVLVRFASWAVTALPLWWGTAGLFFVVRQGPPELAWDAIAAAAKRRWAVQITEPVALQWDAVAGLHTVGWLTLVGEELAATAGITLDRDIPANAESVYVRRGRFGLVCAAGSAPVHGDVNLRESLAPYRAVNELLEPLLLQATRPWPGAFARPELRQAWIGRFGKPQAWLEASVDLTD
jgi:hypothetical protein